MCYKLYIQYREDYNSRHSAICRVKRLNVSPTLHLVRHFVRTVPRLHAELVVDIINSDLDHVTSRAHFTCMYVRACALELAS